jgi:hypothetical protein
MNSVYSDLHIGQLEGVTEVFQAGIQEAIDFGRVFNAAEDEQLGDGARDTGSGYFGHSGAIGFGNAPEAPVGSVNHMRARANCTMASTTFSMVMLVVSKSSASSARRNGATARLRVFSSR